MSAVHGTFTITRELPHAPERVYAARLTGRWKRRRVTDFNARYLDIVPLRRIVYAYSMRECGTGALMDRLARSLEG